MVSLEDDVERAAFGVTMGAEIEGAGFRLATRCAVAGGKADICIGGRFCGFNFLGSVDESVY